MAIVKKKFERPSKSALLEWIAGYFFASPFILGFLAFIAFPMAYSIWLAFHKWDLLTAPRYVGFENILKVLQDPVANLSLYNSAYYTIFAVPIQLVISFTIALALTQPLKFRDFYRAGYYLPIIVPIVASAVVWQRVFHFEFGIINDILGWVGIPPQKWLWDPALAKPAFIFMSFWMIGRQMVIFIAGLGNIPESLYEAAGLDGAGPLRKLMHVTIPLMTPLIFYNMVIAIVNSFQTFVPALVMTDGGPERATLFAVLNIWRNGFTYFNMGYSATLAWELFIIIVGFTIAQFYISKRWVYYED
jgi:multiple sugar transport system permease protein